MELRRFSRRAALATRPHEPAGRAARFGTLAEQLRGKDVYLPVLVRVAAGDDPRLSGLVQQTGRFASGFVLGSEIDDLERKLPGSYFSWSAPRRPFLDASDEWTEARAFRRATGFEGVGSVVGVVDTGIDLRHEDFRDDEGRLRVRWLLDFSRPPAGLQPVLEEAFGCTGRGSCAVYSRGDLEQLLARDAAALPEDVVGHGTFVTSIAAGNGRAGGEGRYVGVAPLADLVVVRASRGAGGKMQDPDIVTGARFVFDRAQALGKPAVVNLSLGSAFGPHDDRAPVAALLAELAAERAGRAIVVAAGNDAGLLLADGGYPGPYGSHTAVHVPEASPTRVPLLLPEIDAAEKEATVLVWIGTRAGDRLRVGAGTPDDTWISPIEPGTSAEKTVDDLAIEIWNGGVLESEPWGVIARPGDPHRDAIVSLSGNWGAERVVVLELQGHATAELWVETDAEETASRALFPRAQKEGSIAIPAAHSGLIAVGATLNRVRWQAYTGASFGIESHGSLSNPHPDTPALFSAAGPSAAGAMKPDLVAPGAFVVAAMAGALDPRANGGTGMFAAHGTCSDEFECLVVDAHHAVAGGTSMSAPFVSGAAALLLERDPTLTQEKLRAILQAGAHALAGTVLTPVQTGAGRLDLGAILEVLDAERDPRGEAPDKAESSLTLAASFVTPDEDAEVEGMVRLRSSSGAIADGFDHDALDLRVENLLVREPLARRAPGLYRFRIAASRGSGGTTGRVRLSYRGRLIVEQEIPIAVDPSAADVGFVTRGGCTLAPRAPGPNAWIFVVGALLGVGRVSGRRSARWRARPCARFRAAP